MKSITNLLLSALTASILFSAFPKSLSAQSNTITLRAIDDVANASLLNESSKILKNRLENFGIKDFAINVLENQNSIELSFKEEIDPNELKSFLTSKGRFEFYETYDRNEILDQLSKDDILYSLLNIPATKKGLKNIDSSSILGSSIEENKWSVERYLRSKQVMNPTLDNVKFAWGNSSNDSCKLFLLRKNSIFDGSYIQECVGKYHPDSNNADIIISFTPEGAEIWKETTKQNIGKSIAIVMDNKVYYAPKLKSVIENGKCRITGNFSKSEVDKLLCLINNRELPMNFEMIK